MVAGVGFIPIQTSHWGQAMNSQTGSWFEMQWLETPSSFESVKECRMSAYKRRSPVQLSGRALKRVERGGWEVVLQYEGEEGPGPCLIDLSHRPKWFAQGGTLGNIEPWGLHAPETPGQVAFQDGFLVNRMGASQAALWHLGESSPAGEVGEEAALTDVTDGLLLIGVVGKRVLSIADKLTTLDLADSKRKAPFLLQGPFCHVPASVVVLKNQGDDGAFLVACSRGYGHDMVEALTHAGESFGIKPAGERALAPWLP
jgi:hypothetical protein